MVLEKLNLGPLRGKQLDRETQKAQALIEEDNRKIDDSESARNGETLTASIGRFIGLSNSSASQVLVNEQKKQFKERDKNRRSAGRNIFKTLQSSIRNFNKENNMEGFLASAKELTHRMTSLSSGKFLDTVFAFFANGREVNQIA